MNGDEKDGIPDLRTAAYSVCTGTLQKMRPVGNPSEMNQETLQREDAAG